jgi:competence ComEA-like helix-hairpin-helix protein
VVVEKARMFRFKRARVHRCGFGSLTRPWCRSGVVVMFLAVAAGLVCVGVTRVAHAAKKTVVGVININEAPAAVLVLLPGVGPAKAERIIAYRQRHRFATVEELGRVKGIGPKTVRKLRLFLTVRGPTTAQAPGSTVASNTSAASSVAMPVPVPAPASKLDTAAARAPRTASSPPLKRDRTH